MANANLPADDCDDETYLADHAEKYGQPRSHARIDVWSNGRKPLGRREASLALQQMGPYLYAARFKSGIIKFGCTSMPLSDRMDKLRCHARQDLGEDLVGIIAIRFGTMDDEAALHHSLAAYVCHGKEWYFPTPEVLDVVNEWRTDLGQEPLAA